MRFLKNALLTAVILLASHTATAGCIYIAELYSSNLYIDISDGGCGELSISFTNKIGKDGRPDYSTIKSFPFNEECILHQDKNGVPTGLTCHAKGRTPLTGATYKRRKAGHIAVNCGYEGEKVRKEDYFQYVCIRGCSKPSVPKTLDEPNICD